MSAPRRPPSRSIDGVILLDKPAGISSNQALQKVRHLFNAAKAGHTGTLDPMATGLLPVCLGEATKFSSELLDADKRYAATVFLGVETDSGDAEGKVIAQAEPVSSRSAIEQVVASFQGTIAQVPPMYSALKREGKPLYEYARAGIELEREPRHVMIHEIRITSWNANGFEIDVQCSKGTYIRSLAIDIGVRLGCGAHLSALRRTGIGRFSIDQAHGLPKLQSLATGELDGLLEPADFLLAGLPVIALDQLATERMGNGQRFRVERPPVAEGRLRMYSSEGKFLGLGRISDGNLLQPERLVAGNGVA